MGCCCLQQQQQQVEGREGLAGRKAREGRKEEGRKQAGKTKG